MVNCVTGTREGGAGIPSCRVLRSAAPETPGAAKVLQVTRREAGCPAAERHGVQYGRARNLEKFSERGAGDVSREAGPGI